MPNTCGKINFLVLVCFFTMTIWAEDISRDFLTHGPGVVAYGRGETTGYGGLSDLSFTFYNPAMSAMIKRGCVDLSSYILFDGSLYSYLGLGQPLSDESMFTLSGINLRSGDIELRQNFTDQARVVNTNQWLVCANFSGDLRKILGLYAGLNINYLYNDFVVAGGGNISLDIGLAKVFNGPVLFRSKSQIYTGLACQSLIRPAIKLLEDTETYPARLRLQTAWTLPVFYRYNPAKQIFHYDRLGIYLDTVLDTGKNNRGLALGADYCFINRYFIRAGLNTTPTFGFGYKSGDIQLDYAIDLKPYTQFHRLNFAFYWGEVPPEEDEDFNAYMQVYSRIERLYNFDISQAQDMINRKKYDDAVTKLERTIYLLPERTEARDLLKQAKDLSVAAKLSDAKQKIYEMYSAKKYIDAWRNTVEALNISPQDQDTKQLLEKIYNDALVNNLGQIATIKRGAIDNLIGSIRSDVEATDFGSAQKRLMILRALSGEDYTYFELRNILNESKRNYISKEILKANNLVQEKRFSEAMIILAGLDKIDTDDQGQALDIKSAGKSVAARIQKQKPLGTKDRMYCDRLYYLAAEYYDKDDLNNARQTIFALINFNPGYVNAYPLYNQVVAVKEQPTGIKLSDDEIARIQKEYQETRRQNAIKEFVLKAKLYYAQKEFVRAYENYLNAYDLDWTNPEIITALKDIYTEVQTKSRPKGTPPKAGEWQEMMADVLVQTGRKSITPITKEENKDLVEINEIIKDYIQRTKSAIEVARDSNDLLTVEQGIQKLKMFLSDKEIERLRKSR